MQSSSQADKMILIGNPGTGKSSSVNCFLGEKLFRSGASSNGVGVTFQLDCREHQGKFYMDTPGLSDLRLRKAAARAIDEALQQGGNFQIIFALTTEAGRLKPDDLTTMMLVFEAANQIKGENQYGIFVNKCSKGWLKRLDKDEWKSFLHEALRARNIPCTDHIHFAPKIEGLEDEDDAIVELDEETKRFFSCAPVLQIDTEHLQNVNADSFEEAMANWEAELEESRRQAEQPKACHFSVQGEVGCIHACQKGNRRYDCTIAQRKGRRDQAQRLLRRRIQQKPVRNRAERAREI